MKRYLLPLLAIVGTLLILNSVVWRHERLLASGATVYLPLAPVDPRSLLQGDYMALDYELTRRVADALQANADQSWPESGTLFVVLRPDAAGVARAQRVSTAQPELLAGEYLLQVRLEYGTQVRLPSHSFFFAEGEGGHFAAARYAILRLSPDGRSLLAGLADARKQPL
ncbi:GDYXXLXY domain-containing protein [Chitinilyticum piscinae]|uniref:GDYXXLXY domain-containing protein n=1 Tax=Chitinilyticum piscinae TaxID=2866724 RepID=A0A8J7FI57_9NEIS|nr:GDYXXLXY domain-containing protein [Chitinilyticum piscinae]MBE9608655.1 GDYXXLXY domain-containing protein [Chitinilyticum piscinae]